MFKDEKVANVPELIIEWPIIVIPLKVVPRLILIPYGRIGGQKEPRQFWVTSEA